MTTVQVVQNDFRDIRLSPHLYEMARNHADPATREPKPLTLTEFLELSDPSSRYDGDARLKGTDAFQRQLIRFGIRTDPGPAGAADRGGAFWATEEAAALFPEWIRRVWFASQSIGGRVIKTEGQRFYMSSSPVSDVLYPDYISNVVKMRLVAPAIPLSLLIARTDTADSGVYIAYRLTENEAERQMHRTPEGTDVPEAELTGADNPIRMQKYGRSLKVTYEAVRRMRLDKLALHLSLLALQTEVDKVADAIDTAINGDGNSGTAATNYDLNGDLGGVVSTPVVADYIAWRMKWPNPYNANVVLGTEATIKTLMTMDAGTANALFIQLGTAFGGFGTIQAANPQLNTVVVGWTSAVSANKWLGLDNRYALEMIEEAGAALTETDMLIRGQFNRIVMTESLNFAVVDVNASRTCDLST